MINWPPIIKKHPNLFMAISYFGIIWPLYVVINHLELNDHFKKHELETWLDRLIPFEPNWVFFYGSMYAFVILPFVYVKDRQIYKHMWFSFCLTGLIAYIIFLVFPVFDMMRHKDDMHQFAQFFLGLDNEHDTPYNCFPSLHVGFSMTAGLWTYYADRTKVGLAVLIWGLLVSLSVLLVKEHYIADLIAGATIAGGLFYYFSRNLKSKITTPRDQWTNRKIWLLVPIALYLIELTYVYVKFTEQ
jgi:membrane-associated phospholipid phosphatase